MADPIPDPNVVVGAVKVDWWKTIESLLQVGTAGASLFPAGAAVMAVLSGLSQAAPMVRDAISKFFAKPEPSLAEFVALQNLIMDYKSQIPDPADVIANG